MTQIALSRSKALAEELAVEPDGALCCRSCGAPTADQQQQQWPLSVSILRACTAPVPASGSSGGSSSSERRLQQVFGNPTGPLRLKDSVGDFEATIEIFAKRSEQPWLQLPRKVVRPARCGALCDRASTARRCLGCPNGINID